MISLIDDMDEIEVGDIVEVNDETLTGGQRLMIVQRIDYSLDDVMLDLTCCVEGGDQWTVSVDEIVCKVGQVSADYDCCHNA